MSDNVDVYIVIIEVFVGRDCASVGIQCDAGWSGRFRRTALICGH